MNSAGFFPEIYPQHTAMQTPINIGIAQSTTIHVKLWPGLNPTDEQVRTNLVPVMLSIIKGKKFTVAIKPKIPTNSATINACDFLFFDSFISASTSILLFLSFLRMCLS